MNFLRAVVIAVFTLFALAFYVLGAVLIVYLTIYESVWFAFLMFLWLLFGAFLLTSFTY